MISSHQSTNLISNEVHVCLWMLMRKCLLAMLMLVILILMLFNLNTDYVDIDVDLGTRIMSFCCNEPFHNIHWVPAHQMNIIPLFEINLQFMISWVTKCEGDFTDTLFFLSYPLKSHIHVKKKKGREKISLSFPYQKCQCLIHKWYSKIDRQGLSSFPNFVLECYFFHSMTHFETFSHVMEEHYKTPR